MADSINNFVDNVQLNALNSLTHLLNTEVTDELNIIRHSPYTSDDELIQSRLHHTNGLSILSLNCQSLQAKFDYIKVIDKFCDSNHPLQVICLQETWFRANTDLSTYIIPVYHIISTGPHSKKIPQIYHKYTTNIPQIYHKYTTNIPQIYHKYTTNISQKYYKM